MSSNSVFQSKSVLFREGDEASKMFIIKSGKVLCLKHSKERLVPVFMGHAEDIIGESAMLSNAPHTYSAIALSEVEVITIDTQDFRDVLSVAPEWLSDLTSTMVARFQNTAGLVAENRVLHSAILSEEDFPSSLEIEYKKLLNQ